VIAREARCAKGLVTYHFGGRDQLLAAVAADLLGQRVEAWRRALSAESIDTVIAQVTDLLSGEAADGFWLAWIRLSAEDSKLTVQTVNNHWSVFAELVSASITSLLADQGLEPSVPAGEFGQMIAAGFQGLGLQAFNGAGREAIDGAHAALWAATLSLTSPAR
jgi:AcrR family transcriptional regulator